MKNEKNTLVTHLSDDTIDSLQQQLLDALPCMALILKPLTKEIVASNHAARTWGAVSGTKTKTSCFWRLAPDTVTIRSEQRHQLEIDGIHWDAYWVPMDDDHYLFYATNVTDRKRSDIVLKNTIQSLERYRKLFLQMPEAAFIVAPDGIILDVNDAAAKQLGYRKPELIGRPLTFIYDEESLSQLACCSANLSSNMPVCNKEVVIRTKEQEKRTVLLSMSHVCEENGKVIHTISLQNDITDIKRLEEEHQRCLKLESLGQLAGGIAHDFNNLLGGIYGYIDLAGAKTTDERVIRYLSKALTTIERAKSLTRQLLTFAKGGAPVKRTDRLFPFVKNRAVAGLADTAIIFECFTGEELWQCDCDRNQIGLVIDNLIGNAVQAMPEGGTLIMEVNNRILGQNEHTTLAAGNYLEIRLSDSGIGIAEDILPHIFDPFFTTKPRARGLGLATCYSIINRHGGSVDATSCLGCGTSFTLLLPAVTQPISPVFKELEHHFTGSGTVIVVDDEEIMRETIGEMLTSLGYSVVVKGDGLAAIDYLNGVDCSNIAGIIIDLTIPGGIGGKDAVDKIHAVNPSLRVLVASGYADDPVMSNPQEFGFTASIAKPFRRNELISICKKYFL